MSGATLAEIYRYPVKGLTPERLDTAELRIGDVISGDRAYAIENGPSGFDEDDPQWLPKTKFVCWMPIPKAAALKARFEDAQSRLTIEHPRLGTTSASLEDAEGRAAIEAYVTEFLGEQAQGALRIVSAGGHSFSDVPNRVVSLINLASVDELSAEIGQRVDPLRFRGNLHLAGLDPWIEATWLNRLIAIGDTHLRVVKTTRRCLATHVDPDRGERDLDVLGTLRRLRGDLDCGVYAEVVRGGPVRPGDPVELIDETAAA